MTREQRLMAAMNLKEPDRIPAAPLVGQRIVPYRTLIDIVGGDGGFILSTGCETPIDAKFGNMRAMMDAPKMHPATFPPNN